MKPRKVKVFLHGDRKQPILVKIERVKAKPGDPAVIINHQKLVAQWLGSKSR